MAPELTPRALDALLARVLVAVDTTAYQTPAAHVDPAQRAAMLQIEAAIQVRGFSPGDARALAARLHAERRIDRVHYLSALHVIAAHPAVADYAEAARLCGEQEVAALELGGPLLHANLASVDRHRGVLAFLLSQPSVALDHFTRALERQHNVENLGNVLCALVALDAGDEAADLVARVRTNYPETFRAELDRRIQSDPDLALLRTPEDLS